MKTISINKYIESYTDMPTDKKSAILQHILFEELYFDEPVRDWLRKALKSETDDSLRPMMAEALAAHIDEAAVRDDFEDVLKELPKNSMTYYAVKEILITALADDMEEVKKWGSRLIKTHEKINPADKTRLSEFLFLHLKDETLPPRLRWHAALGLSHLGTHLAIRHLLSFGRNLIQKISPSGQSIENDIRIFLAEKIAHSIGAAHEQVSAHRKREEALELLEKMREQISLDSEEDDPILYAIDRIQRHPPSPDPVPVPFWVRFLNEVQEFISTPKLVGAMATACLIIALASAGRVYTPIFTDIRVIGNPGIPHIRMKGPAPAPGPEKKEFDLKQGEALQSGEFFKVNVRVNRDAFVYVLLCDSSGEIAELISDRLLLAGRTLSLPPDEKNRFQLDGNAGTETVFVLTSKKRIDKFDQRLGELKKAGISELSRIFPQATVQSFPFEHQQHHKKGVQK